MRAWTCVQWLSSTEVADVRICLQSKPNWVIFQHFFYPFLMKISLYDLGYMHVKSVKNEDTFGICDIRSTALPCHGVLSLMKHVLPTIERTVSMSMSEKSTHNLLLCLEDAHLAEADVEWGRFECSILLFHHHHVDCTSQGWTIDLGVELLRRKRGVGYYYHPLSYLDVLYDAVYVGAHPVAGSL